MSLSSIWTERELLQALERNIARTAVVTSSVRAARALRQRYNQWRQTSGNPGWMTPQILAWEPWLGTLWDGLVLSGDETRVLLTEAQELQLWQKVLAQDEAAKQTLSTASLAEQAQRSWKEMHRYKIPLRSVRGDSNRDTQAFYIWATEIEKLCRASSFLSPSLLEAAIAQTIPSNTTSLPEEIFLVGFDRVPPSQTLLIEALDAAGCSVHFVELQHADTAAPEHAIVYASTLEEEIASAAWWIRSELLKNPMQRIGVIVPALAAVRDQIDAIFRHLLAPSSLDVLAPRTMLPYEFSLGTPMHLLQPIRTALACLRWLQGPIPVEEISWLVVHGSFSSGSLDARARLDKKFRDRDFQLGGPVALSAFRQWFLQAGNREEFAPLRRTIERLFAIAQVRALERPRSFAEWRETIEELLLAADWHLLHAADSADYQLLQRWNTLLNELSSLNLVAGPVRFSVAHEKLQHMAANTLFALESRNTPVQILGVSESAGLLFDSVWWLNAQASAWPPHGRAQPFLPWSLQREAHMPYADHAADYAFARQATQRIVGSGRKVIFSFAIQESDPATASANIPNREVLLSPLVREILPVVPLQTVEEFLPERSRTQPAEATVLENIYEEPAVAFDARAVRGGVEFLRLQAACPFRAFAELRLGTRRLAEPGTGLSASAQGSILHQVLQKFWNEMASQKNLLASFTEQHRQILRGHIRAALAEFVENAHESWQRTLLEIEAERMEARLLAWLEIEKHRPEFTVLETENKLEHIQLAGIELSCRIDRIDAVNQGIALIDYKTGPVDRKACEGERPDQPQMPAYAVLRNQAHSAEQPLAGVAFAGQHARKVEFTVVCSLPSVFEPAPEKTRAKTKFDPDALSPEEMQAQLETWNKTLTALAEDFQTGVAVVDPKKMGETCRHCQQALLCRIGETQEVFENALLEEQDAAERQPPGNYE